GVLVGGVNPGEGNTIAYNTVDGITFTSNGGLDNSLLGNLIFANDGLGIDLNGDGVTPNDSGDGDTGPNSLQNFPVLASATSAAAGTTVVGTLNSNASTTYRIEFFSNPTGTADPTGYGEGQRFLGFTTVTTDGSGNASFNVLLAGSALTGPDTVTATATVDLGGGSYGGTSEFALNVAATGVWYGTNGDDPLTGGTGDDHFEALSGNDTIAGGGGADIINADDVTVADMLTADPTLQYNAITGKFYKLISTTATWANAKAAAEALSVLGIQGRLVTIDSADENTFVKSVAAGSSVWLGATDTGHQDAYVWVNGNPVTYQNFAAGQPDAAQWADGLLMQSNGTWLDQDETTLQKYIVEFAPLAHADLITGGAGNDTIEGGVGRDTAVFSSVSTDYTITDNGNGTWTVTDTRGGSPDGADLLSGVEQFRFTDRTFDTTLNAYNSAPTDLTLTTPGTDLVAQPITDLHSYTGFNGYQHNAVALADGGYAILYSTYDNNSGWDIMVQRYDAADNEVGSPYLLDRDMLSHSQYETDVAVLSSGKIAVTWRDSGYDGNADGIFVKLFDASLNSLTSKIQANTTTWSYQQEPDITATGDGGFVITWRSYADEDSNGVADYYDVYAQKFDANGTKVGSEIVVDNRTGYQYQPSVAGFDDGSFLIVYRNDNTSFSDGSGSCILGQYYDASGVAVGGKFIVNTTTSGTQHDTQSLSLSGNKVLVTYRQNDGSSFGIYGKIYDSAGTVLKNEYLLNTTTSGEQWNAEFRSLSDGGFLVVYTSGDAGSNYRVLAQRYDNAGTAVGSELALGSYSTDYRQQYGTVVELTSGELVFSWLKTSNFSEATMTDDFIWRQRFSLSGVNYVAESDVLDLNLYSQVTSLEADITPLATGGHVVVWRNQGIEPSGGTTWGVLAQIFDGNGVAVGAPFSLAQANQTSNQYNPVVSATPDGGFVAAWQSDGAGGDGNSYGIRVAKYDGSGSIVTSEILANTTTSGTQEVPAVTVASDGSFVVTWRTLNATSSTDYYDVYMQRFDASGNKLGSETRVNTTVLNAQLYQEQSTNADGKTLVVWADNVGDTSGYGVYGKIYDASGTVIASDFLINTDYQYSTQYLPAVSTLNDGRFIVVWSSYTEDGSRYTAIGRIVNADGTFATGHIRLNQWTAADQQNVEVAKLNNGGFVATWTSSGDGQSYAVWGRMFDASGLATSDEFRVSDTEAGWGYKPRVAQRSDGSLIFIWNDYDTTAGSVLRQRIYTPGLIASTTSGAVIGQFIPTDADPNETFTFEIIAADTTDFELDGDLLIVKDGAVFDPYSDPPRNITVRVTDSVGNTYDEAFTINPTPVNQAPTSLTFTPPVLAENATNGSVVGTAIGGDPDIGDSLTYTLVFDADGRFAIDANTGEVTVANASLLDFDSAATHSITIKATDTGSLAIIKAFTITLSNVNENSTDILASGPGTNLVTNGSFESDLTGWTTSGVVGASTAQTPSDGTKQAIFNSGGGANDGVLSQNVATTIGQTYTVFFDYAAYGAATAQTLRFEAIGAATLVNQALVSVGASPGDHRTYAFTFVADSTTTTLRFSDEGSNAASTDIDLDNVRMYSGVPTVAENSTGGTLVARLGANDPDGHDDVTYSLVGGDTTNFEVVGSELRVKSGATLDYETLSTHTVTIRSTDELGLTFDEVVSIAITDVNDAPVIGNISFGTATWSGSTSKTVTGAWNGTADQQYLVDTDGSYIVRFTGVSDSTAPSHYAGLAPYDIDLLAVHPYTYLKYAGAADTTLAVDLLPGATQIVLADATGWYNGVTSHFRSIGWYPYVDSLGDSYGINYTRDYASQIWAQGGISGNVITLIDPWSGPALSAGTAVGNVHSGGNYLYSVLSNSSVATTPTEYTGTISGQGGNSYEYHMFPPGTAYVSPLLLTNHNGSGPTNTVTWSNVSMESTDWKLAALELSTSGTSMGSVLAADADAGDTYTWSLTDNADGLFAIDSVTGEITVAGTLPDFETAASITITVRVTDAGGLYDEQAVSIKLVDLQTITTVTTTADNNDAGLEIGNAAHTTKWLYDNRGADGEVSLREAIIAANNTVNLNGNPDEIRFNIATSDPGYNRDGIGVFTIQVNSELPTISDAVIIDATTQSQYISSPVIEIDGSNAGANADGFSITGGDSAIRGLAINGFDGDGINISGDGLNDIEANYIGIR
ncbi:MAG: cadherin domain-containing protein, partial [Planctomycetaceae bacterium]|nr:cadherin domain-containing protein [Planctomycetaceae bacterium]